MQKPIQMLNLGRQYEYMKPRIDAAIERCLGHQRWIGGPELKEFEERAAEYLGAGCALGVSSGTDALVIALRALALKREGKEYFVPGDEVLTSPFTFTATGEAILRSGATPVFVDVDERTFNMRADLVEDYIKTHPEPEKIKGILVVHLFGQAAPMGEVMDVARRHGLFVVEDTAQAFGARWRGKKLGTLGDAGCFSFFPSKNLGGFGDGGMVVSDDDGLTEYMRILANHGGRDKYMVELLGYNARLDTVQAAVLGVRLGYLDEFNERRRRTASLYNRGLEEVAGIITPVETEEAFHVYHQYTLRVTDGRRDALREWLEEQGVATMVYYPTPLNRMKLFEDRAKTHGGLETAETLSRQVMSLPVEPLQKDEETTYIVDSIKEFMGRVEP